MGYSNLPFFILWEDVKAISKHPNSETRKLLEPGKLYGVHNNISASGTFYTRGSYIYHHGLSKLFDITGSIRSDEFLLNKYKIKDGDTIYYNDKVIHNVNFEVKYIEDIYQIVFLLDGEYIKIDDIQSLEEFRNNIIDDILF